MRTLAHLSDLHFGRVEPRLADALVEAVGQAAPDLTAISGDLTQRARAGQFREARAFLDRLPTPFMCVPGNHDIPLENLPLRLAAPWRGWRRWISRELEPSWEGPGLKVVGVNTVNRYDWQRGRITLHAARRACDAFGGAHDASAARVLVAHHPFEHGPDEGKSLMRGAGRGLRMLAECGADVVLTGHLHAWRAGPVAAGGALQVQAGTSLSTRRRGGQENDFNLLSFDRDEIAVDRFAATEAGRFEHFSRNLFRRGPQGWRPAD